MPEHVPNTVLYNKNLEPPHNTATVPDSHGGRISGETMIAQHVGWEWAPAEAEPPPGEQAKAVEYRPVTPEASVPDLEAKTVPELQDMLRDRDLPTTGNKGDLIDRLTTADDQSDDEAQEG